jgi:hypothetical protein
VVSQSRDTNCIHKYFWTTIRVMAHVRTKTDALLLLAQNGPVVHVAWTAPAFPAPTFRGSANVV